MGMTKKCFVFEEDSLRKCGIEYEGSDILELGNQRALRGAVIHFYPVRTSISAKQVYLDYRKVNKHVSFDINGRDGAIPIDLDADIPEEYHDMFDIVTNYGTIEHINNQYSAFKNIHNAARVGSAFIHAFPLVDNWIGHCRYYYDIGCLKKLCDKAKYTIIDMNIGHIFGKVRGYARKKKDDLMVFAAWTKTADSLFPTEDQFKDVGIYDSGNKKRTGDYSR